jgi:hypothetical protein
MFLWIYIWQIKNLEICTFSCDMEILNGKFVFWKKLVVTCVKLLSSNLSLNYEDDRDKPLALECDRAQIFIQDNHAPCRSSRFYIIWIYAYDSLMTSRYF